MSDTLNRNEFDEFLQEVESLTTNVITELFSKWRSMYEFTEELKTKRLNKFINYLRDYYDEILESEEKKRVEMINVIDKTLLEYYNLQKDLQVQTVDDVRHINVKEPYITFLNEIESSMEKYRKMKEERLEQLEAFRSKEKELCDLLEIDPVPDFPNSIPNEQELESIESHIFELSEEKINRIESYKESKHKIINLMRQMEYEPESDFEIEILSSTEHSFVPSGTNMRKLQDLLDSLEREYNQKFEYKACLVANLKKLWDRISIDENEREVFLSKWNSVGKSHIKAINDEIKRCEEIKIANIKPIIEKVREEIRMYWDMLTFSDEQRLQFKAFTTDHYSDDVLDLHELELERLQNFYQKYQHIFELAEKRNELWKRMLHLDEIAMDKTRLFNNRGGQLLKEEKERKTLEINLPKVDKQLKCALIEYKNTEGRPLLWCGVDLLDQITREWAERLAAKESKKVTRKMENQKQIEEEAKLGSRTVPKRKLGTPLTNVSQAKARRCDELSSQTIIIKGGVRTPGKLPNIRTPLNISTASIASYSHFQDNLQHHTTGRSRSPLLEIGNQVPGIGHSSPTLSTPCGRRGTPVSALRSNPHTIPRLVRARTRLPLDF